jgi:hypothetical protein
MNGSDEAPAPTPTDGARLGLNPMQQAGRAIRRKNVSLKTPF